MTELAPSAAVALRRLVNGYRVSQAIHVAVQLGIPDLLQSGPRASDDLAAETRAHPRALYRLLRFLAAHGVLVQQAGRHFALSEVGAGLCTDAPGALGSWAAYLGRPHHWNAWAELLHSVQTGENAFVQLHGSDVWSYRAQHPEEGAAFQRFMTGNTLGLHAALLAAYDFGRFGCLVDVGGGQGALLAALLQAHPRLRGVVLDQPQVAQAASEYLRAAGLEPRGSALAGSFFEAVPAGGDAYVLKWVLHDWDDRRAALILRRCRQAMTPDATLLVIERVLAEGRPDPEGTSSDLSMLVGPGGQERSLPEFTALLAHSGFRLTGCLPIGAGMSVLEARPVLPG